MDLSEPDARPQYAVVVNDEEQHSLWPAILPVPLGWREVGFRGDEERCLERIAELWPGITPRSERHDHGALAGRG